MTALDLYYENLKSIREAFHKYGRFNDSNSKLDEISKLLAIYIDNLKRLDTDNELKKILLAYKKDNHYPIVESLKKQLKIAVKNPLFQLKTGESIFNDDMNLLIDNEDKDFAFQLLNLIIQPIEGNSIVEKFDIVNETFGHFVRDNFRNNIEDAQYMTPFEVVSFMADLAIANIAGKLKKKENISVLDPCCGVGSFLNTFIDQAKKIDGININNIKIIGQDKVPRMLRLAKLNLSLNHPSNNEIYCGNSLIQKSSLDQYENKIDLILTNPPFGAKFLKKELINERKLKYPVLFDIFENTSSINSEILFIDRCISLLKNNGELLAVVPDSLISSQGTAEILRYRINNSTSIEIKSIIELPTVTFAQAGTRTKTCILHLQKRIDVKEKANVFIAQSNNIGFEVSTRKGATVKIAKGENDLSKIYKAFLKAKGEKPVKSQKILINNPSCLLINNTVLLNNSWTPNHYHADKIHTIKKLNNPKNEVELTPLGDLVNFITKDRKKEVLPENAKCISILHIVNHDLLDYAELLSYDPIYKGVSVKGGDLLFSKINPRIPRALVVPELNIPLSCSTEFEIMQSKCDISNYGIKALLFLPSVQIQINHLTSGTSSSHNRIKTEDLKKVLIPVPNKKLPLYKSFNSMMVKYESKSIAFQSLNIERFELKDHLVSIFG